MINRLSPTIISVKFRAFIEKRFLFCHDFPLKIAKVQRNVIYKQSNCEERLNKTRMKKHLYICDVRLQGSDIMIFDRDIRYLEVIATESDVKLSIKKLV